MHGPANVKKGNLSTFPIFKTQWEYYKTPPSPRHKLSCSYGWCIAPWYAHYFWSTLWMQNIWSIVDLLRQNPHWWSPVIFQCMELILTEGCWIKSRSTWCVHCRTVTLNQSHRALATILFSTADDDGELVWKRDSEEMAIISDLFSLDSEPLGDIVFMLHWSINETL